MLGFGWCHLRASREALRGALVADAHDIDAKIGDADRALFLAFRRWKAEQGEKDPWLKWDLQDELNNDTGLLTYCLSRNHRTSLVWAMLEWIRDHGPGSYGLFYCHDDEDTMAGGYVNRFPPMDFDNVFRVHRLKNGVLEELPDPFFGLIHGDLNPEHPYYAVQEKNPWEDQ